MKITKAYDKALGNSFIYVYIEKCMNGINSIPFIYIKYAALCLL